MPINGFVNVLKPPGMTSHDVISCMRRIYRTKKIGHAGTLDPAAAGVLPVAVGHATRLLEYMADTDKSYRAEVVLGIGTDTDDDTGSILRQENFIMPETALLKTVLKSFCGEIMQVPPAYSAIKINGQKAYELARQNIEVKIAPRRINIYGIELLGCMENGFSMDVDCSKGTYIRSLCADIGKALNIPAVMGFLLRTRAGAFRLAEANTLEELSQDPAAFVQGMDILRGTMETCDINDEMLADFYQGRKIEYNGEINDGTALLIYCGDIFAGIGKVSDGGAAIAPHKVFNNK
ncbi:tRNA pseudouridine(55) synthase TruB [Pectinatus haikarae]|uniref:tRNA pseudouridine synthase B n=1 Tax=Pectinatus haikarae TaxID=349096 RepID=A0ABT9Y6I9_9FIRM|nr:tRNA pseudouridine(55) synthase TruB [Pectinatus haikarae]MDQ0203451.1 tRNA pseudouridine55 synthase [Pectinatus haikarae]